MIPHRPRHIVTCVSWLILSSFIAIPASAEVVRFELERVEAFAGGESFGEAGPYQRVIGRVFYEIDPSLRQNGVLVDLEHCRTNERGRVEFTGEFDILAPVDLGRSNGAVFYDVNNRGNKLALRMFNEGGGGNNPLTREDAGNGFLMRQGYIVVWSGWDGELLPGNGRLRLTAPVARPEGGPITGLVRCEIVPTQDVTRCDVNWANHGSYRPTQDGLENATLTHRERPGDPRVTIPRNEWTLHVTDQSLSYPARSSDDRASQLPRVELELPAGMKQGHIYEVIYEAEDPLVMGVGLAGLRDLIAAFRNGSGEDNPLLVDDGPVVTHAYGFGVSQSGRFLREFLYWGFNEDEAGREVFDGLIPHVAGGGLGSFNHRFAQPTRHVTQHDHHDYPADRFPFSYETQCNPLTGRVDGILRRAEESGTAPIVMHTQSSAEYWTRSGSLPHTDPLGRCDANPPPNVRFFSFGGTQHGPSGFPPTRGDGQNLANPGDYRPFLRALLTAMDRWARDGIPAPPSVMPRIADGTLVDWRQDGTGFPDIPGVTYPEVIQQPSLWDFGPRWEADRIIDRQPPGKCADYRVLAARCDPDGNVLGCLLPPEVAVPVATYTGWNLRRDEAGAANELVSLRGSYIPFPATREQREASDDPRASVEERYGDLETYLTRLEAECRSLVDDGYLLEEDVDRIVARERERVAPVFESFAP
ncbi:MAG: hypothetical protein DWQ34_04565 [Planctomycetota bacterium]|nr:MAG: hypothetical protein DWQ34_04565 [Planctomycetota bacterium]REK21084.1 MAG: hypothetical protein DWQ41_22710 [Planctomycetota bacterium]REK28521.1 MAG: hypothetical protein DWQ45_24440 [Planctomycetota bacterium]